MLPVPRIQLTMKYWIEQKRVVGTWERANICQLNTSIKLNKQKWQRGTCKYLSTEHINQIK